MEDQQIRRIVEDVYDDSREETYRSMVREFFSRRMRSVALIVWVHFLFFLGLGVVSGILFFRTDRTQFHIMYAAFFICCILISYLIKVFAWVMISRNSVRREIKRLEIRIAELAETIGDR